MDALVHCFVVIITSKPSSFLNPKVETLSKIL